MKFTFIIPAILLTIFSSCNNKNDLFESSKVSDSDPFSKTIVESQFFKINAKEDEVAEAKKGTVLFFPKGCFIDKDGRVVEDNVKVEVAEALSADDMILSNLTASLDGKPMESQGMIYINATANGKPLKINPDNPIYVELPAEQIKPEVMAYKGERDGKGNMKWSDPKPMQNYLLPVDISLLDFYPAGFESAVAEGLPFRKHTEMSKQLSDSLYYSFSVSRKGDLIQGFEDTEYNEAFYNKHNKVVDGKYTHESFNINAHSEGGDTSVGEASTQGIDPAKIKVLWSSRFSNTYIATREFEKRLQSIFKTCNNEVLEIYVRMLDKNLGEADSMAALAVKGTDLQSVFEAFAKEKLTNVKEGERYAALRKKYYEKKLAKVKEDLERVRGKAMKELAKKNEMVEKVAREYKEVLWEREKSRMVTYGCKWTDAGWLVFMSPLAKEFKYHNLEYTIQNGKEMDQVYSYVLYTSIKSLYRLNTRDNVQFYVGNEEDRVMIMPIRKKAIAVVVAYKGGEAYFAMEEFESVTQERLFLSIAPISKSDLKSKLTELNKSYASENLIKQDLEYMEYFYQEKKRQENLRKEQEFINKLRLKVFPCQLYGEELFKESGCLSCHEVFEKKVGPPLAGLTKRRPMNWIIDFIRNSDRVKALGDPYTTKLNAEYGGMAMPQHEWLTDNEIISIFNYIDGLKQESQLK